MADRKLRLLTALCFFFIFASFIGSTQSASCCLMYSKRPVFCRQLLGYTVQTINASCDIKAIIFHLPRRFVCADPSAPWTRRGLECLKRRNTPSIKEGIQANNSSITSMGATATG